MKVEIKAPESVTEPRLWVQHEQVLAMVLQPGPIEWGLRRCEMQRADYGMGDLGICHRHEGEWVGIMDVPSVLLDISDAALMATASRTAPRTQICRRPLASSGRGRECGEGCRVSGRAAVSGFC